MIIQTFGTDTYIIFLASIVPINISTFITKQDIYSFIFVVTVETDYLVIIIVINKVFASTYGPLI